MALSAVPASRSVSPEPTRAVSEQAALIEQLLGVAQHLASQHQSLAGECDKSAANQHSLLSSKDAEIERLLAAEAILRQEYEQQLLVERQQWCLEKDALQRVLQEQQGTAHTVEQQLAHQTADLQAQLVNQQAAQTNEARVQQDSLLALQAANEQLQQQNSKLEVDLQAALAYRHKCLQQKKELQVLRKQVAAEQAQGMLQPSSETQSSAEQSLHRQQQQKKDQRSEPAISDAPASQEDIDALSQHLRQRTRVQVAKLQSERELLKRAYGEEKKKADRYRNAYTQLRDLRPSQQRSKQKPSGAQSMPQLTDLARQQGNAVQLASSGQCDSTNPAAAADCTSNSIHKMGKVRKRPSSHNCFTAEMDLAAAGLLGQAPRTAAEVSVSHDKLKQGFSWPVRNRHTQQQQATSISDADRRGAEQLHLTQSQQQQQQQKQDREQSVWQRAARHQHFGVQGQPDNAGELSPGAKEALILVGLLSEEQEPETDADMTEAYTEGEQPMPQPAATTHAPDFQLPTTSYAAELHAAAACHTHQLQPAAAAHGCNLSSAAVSHANDLSSAAVAPVHELQPWHARLTGHAEALQLDRDSLCRLSDPCHQPSKRSRSCPPDPLGTAPRQPTASTHAVQASGSEDPVSDADSADGDNQACLTDMTAAELLPHHKARDAPGISGDADVSAQQLTVMDAKGGICSAQLAVVTVVAPEQDSLDMTQPNLTPAGQRQQQHGADQAASDPRTAPMRPLPGRVHADSAAGRRSMPKSLVSPVAAASLADFAEDHKPPPAAPAEGESTSRSVASAPVAAQPARHQQQQQQMLVRQVSAQPQSSRPKAAKWKQKAGQRAHAFVENDQPAAAMQTVARQQDAQPQQCWLQQGLNQGDLPMVPDAAAQQAVNGQSFKYQEVVRGKADRAALQGIQCVDCRRFYEAISTWGGDNQPLPACGHALLPGTPTNKRQQGAAAPGLHQDASRHRYRFAPPATPEGLWDMDFPDSQALAKRS